MTVLSKPLANRLFNSSAITNAAIAIIFQYCGDMMKRRRRRIRSAPYPRIRITFQEVFAQLGPVNFRRAFHMTHDSFNSLAHLHNFCIGEVNTRKVPQVFVDDVRNINHNRSGHVDLTFGGNKYDVPVPVDLMHGGEHLMDVPRGYIRARQSPPDQLPRTNIFNLIVDGHWERPTRL